MFQDNDDDEASIQILEPDVDQQYIPERQKPRTESKTPPAANPSPSLTQKPPVLIVERQTVQPANNIVTAPQQPQTIVQITKKEEEPRIVNIIDEPTRIESKASSDWWEQRVQEVVSFVVRFFSMAIVSFLLLVWLNPPFVQEKAFDDMNTLQKRSASLSRAAFAAGLAGLAFIVLPAIWNVLSSKFFPNDILMAAGIKQPKK